MSLKNIIVRRFRAVLSEKVFRLLEQIWEYRLRNRYQNIANDKSLKDKNKIVVWTQDDSINPGGLSDRLQGIVSSFKVANDLGLTFKIDFTSPFRLNDFIIPNAIDWDGYKANKVKSSKVLIFRSVHTHNINIRKNQLIKAIKNCKEKEIHIYTNLNTVDDKDFYYLFHKLFKPSDLIEERLNQFVDRTGKYCSVTFRFQQLLGDFKEGEYPELSDDEKQKLIERCINAVWKIHQHTNMTVLVTADSNTFLDKVKELNFVRVVEGKVIHMAYTKDGSQESHIKSFLDLLLISKAETVFSVCYPPMYNSGFPRLGARIGNKPFVLIQD